MWLLGEVEGGCLGQYQDQDQRAEHGEEWMRGWGRGPGVVV